MKPDYCTRPEVDECANCSLVNYGLDCYNNPIPRIESDEPPSKYQQVYDALINLNPGAKTPHLDALEDADLLDQLDLDQLTTIVKLMQTAYQNGKASAGAEMVDNDAVWLNGIGGLERQSDGSWQLTMPDQGLDLTTDQAAERLGITKSLVRRYIRENRLPASKMGRDWMIKEKDLDEFAKHPRNVGWPEGKPRSED